MAGQAWGEGEATHAARSGGGSSVETIGDRPPFTGFLRRLHHVEFRPRFVALMQLRVDRAGKGLRIARDHGYAAKALAGRNPGMRDKVTGGECRGSGVGGRVGRVPCAVVRGPCPELRGELAPEVVVVAPRENQKPGFGRIMPWQ